MMTGIVVLVVSCGGMWHICHTKFRSLCSAADLTGWRSTFAIEGAWQRGDKSWIRLGEGGPSVSDELSCK
jgi:hypothetical protein